MKRPLSMTGFGRGECAGNGITWTVEVRSVNHRYCDVNVKLPWRYAALEERIKKEVLEYYARGHIDIIVVAGSDSAKAESLKLDLPLARQYYKCLKDLCRELSLPDGPDLMMVASFNGIVSYSDEDAAPMLTDELWPIVQEALATALNNCSQMRASEGQALKNDILNRIANFEKTVGEIENMVPAQLRKREAALQERLDNLLKGVDIEPGRLAQEVAIIADKTDVCEEIVRLHSHIRQFAGFLESDEPVGRKCDFLLQEFLREVNTVASKVADAQVAHLTVDLKNELEKIREQVQNLE